MGDGLKPRGALGTPTSWSEMPSSPDMVYLTSVWALFYSLQAGFEAKGDDGGPPPLCLVEVDTDRLDESLFYPDEDYIVYSHGRGGDAAYTAQIKAQLDDHRQLWGDSLGDYGSLAYRGLVPRSAITRVRTRLPDTMVGTELGYLLGDYLCTRPHLNEFHLYGDVLRDIIRRFMNVD